ncbi:MAG: hypothetical protein ACOZAN_03980 [Patescibacteria group bacterium]
MNSNNQLLSEFKCVYFTKFRVYPERIEIKSVMREHSIPKNKINGVHRGMLGQIIINTVGGEDYQVGVWGSKNGKELYELLKTWQSE